jgi:hypothetical protein
MPECHRCPLDGSGSRECLKCAGPSETPMCHGRVHVQADVLEHGERPILPEPSPRATAPREWEWARRLLTMHRRKTHGKTRDILVLKIAHPEMTNTDIARLLNVTRQNVVKALRVCM